MKARRDVWNLLDEMRQQGMTIVLTSHFMDEVEILCDRIGILKDGGFAFEGTVEEAVACSPYEKLEDAYLWFTGEGKKALNKFFTMLKTELRLSFRGWIWLFLLSVCR